jgi:TatD DNase family protein
MTRDPNAAPTQSPTADGTADRLRHDRLPDWLIDTHCHVDAYPTPAAVLAAARDVAVRVVAVTEVPGGYRRLHTRLGSRSGVDAALGFHPLRVGATATQDLTHFLRLLPTASWVGEIGLDFSRADARTRRTQLQVFEGILADPHLQHLPTTVHSRGAEGETIGRLAQARTRAVLHWYSGSLGHVDDALNAGMFFSINPSMLRSNKGASLLRHLPRARVLLETDGPYSRFNNKTATPADLVPAIGQLAQLWDMAAVDARRIVVHNQLAFTGVD